jgi:hypothetical protein
MEAFSDAGAIKNAGERSAPRRQFMDRGMLHRAVPDPVITPI